MKSAISAALTLFELCVVSIAVFQLQPWAVNLVLFFSATNAIGVLAYMCTSDKAEMTCSARARWAIYLINASDLVCCLLLAAAGWWWCTTAYVFGCSAAFALRAKELKAQQP